MQNLLAAQNEGNTLRKTFEDMGQINGEYTFIIPVFKNMPTTASPRPLKNNPEIETPINTDLVKVNVKGTLNVRKEPGKNSTKIGSVYEEEIITRLEKATQKVDGTYWDYIMTSNGLKGYVARETFENEGTYKLYLVPVNTDNGTGEQKPDVTPEIPTVPEEPTTPETDKVIQNDKIKIDKQVNQITTVPGATVKDFSDLYGRDAVVKKANGEVLSNDAKLGTGCVIDDTYTVVVLGDVNGDGTVDARDSLRILKYSVGTYELKNEFSISADLNKDGVIDARDSLRVLKHSVETYEIKL